MEMEAAKLIGAGLAAIGAGMAAIGVGNVFGSFLESALRNPGAADGQQGRLFIGFAAAELLGLLLHRGGQTTEYHDLRHDWLDSFVDSTQHFVDCILDGGEPRLTGQRGKEVIQLALAALRSAETGRSVRPDAIGGAP